MQSCHSTYYLDTRYSILTVRSRSFTYTPSSMHACPGTHSTHTYVDRQLLVLIHQKHTAINQVKLVWWSALSVSHLFACLTSPHLTSPYLNDSVFATAAFLFALSVHQIQPRTSLVFEQTSNRTEWIPHKRFKLFSGSISHATLFFRYTRKLAIVFASISTTSFRFHERNKRSRSFITFLFIFIQF